MTRERKSWDQYFMDIAFEVATRATCDRAHVGCVLVKDKHILATGYNGSPRGTGHCDDLGHDMVNGHCVRTIHAEVNAIIQCAIHGNNPSGCTVYVTHFPCYECTKVLINADVNRIVYKLGYRPDSKVFDLCMATNTFLEFIDED